MFFERHHGAFVVQRIICSGQFATAGVAHGKAHGYLSMADCVFNALLLGLRVQLAFTAGWA